MNPLLPQDQSKQVEALGALLLVRPLNHVHNKLAVPSIIINNLTEGQNNQLELDEKKFNF